MVTADQKIVGFEDVTVRAEEENIELALSAFVEHRLIAAPLSAAVDQ